MEGTTPADFTFNRNRQAITLDTKAAVKLDGVALQIDPQLLFQRLIIAAKDIFNYHNIQKAVESASLMGTVLVGEDINFLLCYHASLDSHNIFLTARAKEDSKETQSRCQGATGPRSILFLVGCANCMG